MALIDELDSFYTEEQPIETSVTNEEKPVQNSSQSTDKWGGFLDSIYEGSTEEQPSTTKEKPVIAGAPFVAMPGYDTSMGEFAHRYETGEKAPEGKSNQEYGLWTDLKKGYNRGEAAVGDFLSNLAGLLENNSLSTEEIGSNEPSIKKGIVYGNPLFSAITALRTLADKINSSAGGSDNILSSLKNYFKNTAENVRPKEEGNTSIPSAVIQGAAELPATLSTYLLGTALTGGNAVAGMALVDGIKSADKGTLAMYEGAAKGAMLGKILHALSIFSKPVKVGIMSGLFGTSTALEGGGLNETVASAILGGGLAVPGRSPNVSFREAVKGARKPFEPVASDARNPMNEARLDEQLDQINQTGERGRVYPQGESVGREGYIAPTSQLWAELGGRQEAIATTYDYLKRQGFSQERISEIMDMVFPSVDWKSDVVLANVHIEQPNLIRQPTEGEVKMSQLGREEKMATAGEEEQSGIIKPTQQETTLIGGEKKPYMGAREEETNDKTTNVIQSKAENKPSELVGITVEDDARMAELSRKSPVLWTAEDRAFYNKYMNQKESGIITGKEQTTEGTEIIKPNESEIRDYGKSIKETEKENAAKENEPPVPQESTIKEDTGLKNLRQASINDPIGQKKLSKALWENVRNLPKKARAEVESLLMRAEDEQDLGKAGTLLEEAAQRLHRDMPLLRNSMVEEMSEGNPPTGITLGSGPWQSLYERFFPETKREVNTKDRKLKVEYIPETDEWFVQKGEDESTQLFFKSEKAARKFADKNEMYFSTLEEAREAGWNINKIANKSYIVEDPEGMVLGNYSNEKEALEYINVEEFSSMEKSHPIINTGFYSKLGEIISKKVGGKIPVDQLQKMLKNGGVKEQEMKFSGMNEFIDTFKGQTVTKAQIVNYLKEHELLFKDLDIEEPKFERYIRGGGTNYQEKLITFNYSDEVKLNSWKEAEKLGYKIKRKPSGNYSLIGPDKKSTDLRDYGLIENDEAAQETSLRLINGWQNSKANINKKDYIKGHWSDEAGAVNVIGSMITRDDVTPDGKKVLGIREIQSDWDLTARKEGGYDLGNKITPIETWEELESKGYTITRIPRNWVLKDPNGEEIQRFYIGNTSEGLVKRFAIDHVNSKTRVVPDMPFRDKWYEVVLKRAIKYAIDNGYDYISWSTGKQVAEQYNLNKYVDTIQYGERKSDFDNKREVLLELKSGNDITTWIDSKGNITDSDISDMLNKNIKEVIGNELGTRIIEATDKGELTGLDMVITPEGKDALYDVMIPSFVNKFAGKRGGKLVDIEMNKELKLLSEEIHNQIAERYDAIGGDLQDFINDGLVNTTGGKISTFKQARGAIAGLKDIIKDDWNMDGDNSIFSSKREFEAYKKSLTNIENKIDKEEEAAGKDIKINEGGKFFDAMEEIINHTEEFTEFLDDSVYIGEHLKALRNYKKQLIRGNDEVIEELGYTHISPKDMLNKVDKAIREGQKELDTVLATLHKKVGEDVIKDIKKEFREYLEDTDNEIFDDEGEHYLELEEAIKEGYFKNEKQLLEARQWVDYNVDEWMGEDNEVPKGLLDIKESLSKLTFPTGEKQPGLEITSELKKSINEEGMPLYSGIDPTKIVNLFKKLGNRNPEVAEKSARSFNRILDFFNPGMTVPKSKEWFYARQAAKGGVAEGEYLADEFTKMYKDISSEDRTTLWNFMNGTTKLTDLPDNLKMAGKELRSLDNKLGRMLVNAGIMSEETFEAMKDRHIRYIYNTNMTGEEFVAGSQSGAKIPYKAFEQRKELNDIEMERLGLIKDPIKALAQSIVEAHKAVSMKEYFGKISEGKEWIYTPSSLEFDGVKMGIGRAKDIVKTIESIEKQHPEWINAEQLDYKNRLSEAIKIKEKNIDTPSSEFVQLNGKHYGDLDGMYVNRTIANDMKPIFSLAQKFDSELLKKTNYYLDTATSLWKLKSVALNIPTGARNCISNTVQLWMSGMPLYKMPKYFVKAAEAVKNKNDVYLQAMKQGLFKGNWSASELNDILEIVKAEGKGLDKVLEMGRKLGKYYGKIDDFFKMAKFIEGMEKNLGESESARLANQWGMDYSLTHPSIKYIRSTPLGAPFITYQYKVLPLIAEAMMRRPWTVMSLVALPYILQKVITRDMTDEEAKKYNQALPEYVKNGQTMLIPGVNGMNAMDISYMVPWGNWWQLTSEIAKGDIPKATRETGLAGGLIPSLLYALKTGKDLFTGEDIISPLEKTSPKLTAMALTKYLWNQSMPPMLSTYGLAGKTIEHLSSGKTKTGIETTAANVYPRLAGVNIYPIDPRSGMLQRKHEINDVKKALYKRMMDKTLSEEEKRTAREIYQLAVKKTLEEE